MIKNNEYFFKLLRADAQQKTENKLNKLANCFLFVFYPF
jgi:hypothetical protein